MELTEVIMIDRKILQWSYGGGGAHAESANPWIANTHKTCQSSILDAVRSSQRKTQKQPNLESKSQNKICKRERVPTYDMASQMYNGSLWTNHI